MTEKDGITVSEIAKETKKSRHAIEAWLSRHGIKPLSYEARYPLDTLEKIKAVKMGRPPKKPTPEAPKKPRKT